MCVTWGHMGLGHGHGHSRGGGRNGGRGGWHDGAAGAMWRSAVRGVVEREGGRVVGKEALDVVVREHIREITFGRSVRIGTLLPHRNASSGLGCRLRRAPRATTYVVHHAAVVLSSYLLHSMWTYTLLDAFFS